MMANRQTRATTPSAPKTGKKIPKNGTTRACPERKTPCATRKQHGSRTATNHRHGRSSSHNEAPVKRWLHPIISRRKDATWMQTRNGENENARDPTPNVSSKTSLAPLGTAGSKGLARARSHSARQILCVFPVFSQS